MGFKGSGTQLYSPFGSQFCILTRSLLRAEKLKGEIKLVLEQNQTIYRPKEIQTQSLFKTFDLNHNWKLEKIGSE